jgi:hypothetical protein
LAVIVQLERLIPIGICFRAGKDRRKRHLQNGTFHQSCTEPCGHTVMAVLVRTSSSSATLSNAGKFATVFGPFRFFFAIRHILFIAFRSKLTTL